MWRMAKFSGVEVLTYALMDNHFHLLVKVPERAKFLTQSNAIHSVVDKGLRICFPQPRRHLHSDEIQRLEGTLAT
jgi:REP element-mobilizing transposase RayT